MRNIDLTDISFAKKKLFCVSQETHTNYGHRLIQGEGNLGIISQITFLHINKMFYSAHRTFY